MVYNLKGKVALVTGGASGIGLGFVKELLKNELKAVAVIDVNSNDGERVVKELVREFGNEAAIFIKTDVTDKNQLEEAFEKTVKTFKQLDIVINNAGIINECDYEKCIGINFTAVVTGCLLAMDKYLPKYRSDSEAVIVNTSSVAVVDVNQMLPTYTGTKAAVAAFTRALGGDVRYKTTKVRVIAICPGSVSTPIADHLSERHVKEPYLSMFNDLVESLTPQTPEDLAKKVIGLIKDAPTGSVWLSCDKDSCSKMEFPTC